MRFYLVIIGFGWGSWLMNNIMIKRNWASDKKTITEAFRSIREHKLPTWLISYPEGTRLSPTKLLQVIFILIVLMMPSFN